MNQFQQAPGGQPPASGGGWGQAPRPAGPQTSDALSAFSEQLAAGAAASAPAAGAGAVGGQNLGGPSAGGPSAGGPSAGGPGVGGPSVGGFTAGGGGSFGAPAGAPAAGGFGAAPGGGFGAAPAGGAVGRPAGGAQANPAQATAAPVTNASGAAGLRPAAAGHAQTLGGAGASPAGAPAGAPPGAARPAVGAPGAGAGAGAPGAGAAAPAKPATSAADRPTGGRIGISQERRDGDIPLDEVLLKVVELGASDLHLTSGAPPTVRVSGALRPLDGFPILEPDSVQRSVYQVLTQKQREKFEDELELDFAYSVRGKARFRVNLYLQRESLGAAFRLIPYEIKPLESLGVPAVVGNFAGLPRGMVLVTGPTGSGKSTTLAAIIDLANRTRPDHIMTVEDPIEFLHKHKRALVNQREVGEDTKSFGNALKHVLRQDPDIILVGELRDLETISVALTAAETGHLVFATLHTQDAAQTIDRVIDVFPAHQQDQIRTQLASAIQGVVCQTLCKRSDTAGRVVATEVMVATPAIRNLIREGKTHQIYSAMQAGAQQGMHTMDQHLATLVRDGKISYEHGLEKCHHVEDFNRLTGRGGLTQQGAATTAQNY